MYTIRSVIFNLDHEMETLHFISNGEDPYPLTSVLRVMIKETFNAFTLQETSRKPMRYTENLLKIKCKLIFILFTSFDEYIYIYIYIYFFFFVVQNIVGKIDKETLRIEFRIDPTFWFIKIAFESTQFYTSLLLFF